MKTFPVGVQQRFQAAAVRQGKGERLRGFVGHVQQNQNAAVTGTAFHGVDALGFLMTVHPAEAIPFVVVLIQCRFGEIEPVQFQHIVVECIVNGVFQNVPVLLLFFCPLPQLPQFAAHEQQLFAGVCIHI